MRSVLYRADVKLRACSGRERPEQPKSKLFAKLAVELFVLNLIRAFVGVCGHVVSELRVCGVFAMLDHSHAWFGVLLLAASYSFTRLFWMSNRWMLPGTILVWGGKAIAQALQTNTTIATITLSGKGNTTITVRADQLRQNTVDSLNWQPERPRNAACAFVDAELLKATRL